MVVCVARKSLRLRGCHVSNKYLCLPYPNHLSIAVLNNALFFSYCEYTTAGGFSICASLERVFINFVGPFLVRRDGGSVLTHLPFWATYVVMRLRFRYFSDEHHIIDLDFINMFASFLAMPARFKPSPSSVQISTLLSVNVLQFVTPLQLSRP